MIKEKCMREDLYNEIMNSNCSSVELYERLQDIILGYGSDNMDELFF